LLDLREADDEEEEGEKDRKEAYSKVDVLHAVEVVLMISSEDFTTGSQPGVSANRKEQGAYTSEKR
jgi:hypothetical protein